MTTHFAPAEKATPETLVQEISFVSQNPVMTSLLHSIGGIIAVLNRQRQIIALNTSLLKMLGVENPEEVLGLRPGEAFHCIHANKEAGGCGTSKWCSTCGAAIAIVSSWETDSPVEKRCALTYSDDNSTATIALNVKSQPVTIDSNRFLLLYIEDISLEEQRAALERTFFHDINNMISGLIGASELLTDGYDSDLVNTISQIAFRLKDEIAIQQCARNSNYETYKPVIQPISISDIIAELKRFFANHPASAEKTIDYQMNIPELTINTDHSLVLRILSNMIINACEATEKRGIVRVWIEQNNDTISFCCWNLSQIPEEIALRIFQRNFSTKGQDGRGFGTFSMKYFGEKVLGGKLGFVTSASKGTTFRFTLPV